MRSTLIGAVISVALALIGAAVWGMIGTVLLAAVGALIGMAISWHFFVKAMQESGRVPVPWWMAVSMGGRPGVTASPLRPPHGPPASPEGQRHPRFPRAAPPAADGCRRYRRDGISTNGSSTSSARPNRWRIRRRR